MMKLNKILVFSLLLLFVLNSLAVADTNSFKGKDKIAFVSNREGNEDIYIIKDNGQDLNRLTNNEEDEYYPIWSPDGDKILYLSDDGQFFDTTYKLWVMDKDGGNKRMLADDIAYYSMSGHRPAWSPDGSKVLFVTEGKEKKNIVILDVKTGNRKKLTAPETEGLYPAWSPDGSKIVCFLKGKRENGIYVMKSDGSNLRKLTERGGAYLQPTWSPNGDRIAFIYDEPFLNLFGRHPGLYVVNLDGKTGIRLYKSEAGELENIKWSPEGEKISFTSDGFEMNWFGLFYNTDFEDYFMVDRSEGENNYFTNITEVTTKNELIFLAKTYTPVLPSWSSEGKQIAYTNNYSAYVEPRDSSEEISKFDVPYAIGNPKWGPKDNKIVCVGYGQIVGNNRALYVFDHRESKVYKLTAGESIVKHPAWMPQE